MTDQERMRARKLAEERMVMRQEGIVPLPMEQESARETTSRFSYEELGRPGNRGEDEHSVAAEVVEILERRREKERARSRAKRT